MRARGLPWVIQVTAITLMGCGASAVTCLGCTDGSDGDGDGNGQGGGSGTAGSSGSSGSAGASGSGAGGSAGTSKTCEGNRVVADDAAFDALVAEGCEVITGDLRVSRVTYASLNGLQSLTSVGQNLELINVGLDSLSGLENLATVGGALSITNTDISGLSELGNLTSIGGTLGISLNDSLTTLGPLLDWPGNAISGLIAISFNPLLPQCEVETFDASQTNAACNDVSCASNEGTGTCP